MKACNEANQKQKQKCEEDMKLMKPEFRANDPLYCKDEVVVDAAKRLKKYAGYSGDTIQTYWKGEDITFHPNSSGRFEVIEVTREANFNPIEEYRWADEYSERHSISNYGGSGNRYDGSAVRQVKSEKFNNNKFVSLSP
ncbi:hypothetical protein ACE6H2_020841 [Prunus campanulata]